MAEQTTAYIGLGSNLGDRSVYINSALKILGDVEGVRVAGVSEMIETAALGGADQGDYLNAVAEITTTLSAEALLKSLEAIENSLGRMRDKKWGPRTIDLDILLFGAEVINLPDLTVPHPQMHLRLFVLKGLCELNAAFVHPVIKKPVSELTARLNGCDFVLHPEKPQLISVAGIIGVGKTTLAGKLAKLLNCDIMLEPYDTNPFMPEVYAGNKALALDSQLYFLTGRKEQLNIASLRPGRLVITDYIFEKELIYARRLLNAQQLTLYRSIHDPIAANITEPVLAIYLQDSPENCLERIHDRNRPYEQRIETDFLEGLSADYDKLFADWKSCPLIRLCAAELDYSGEADASRLANQLKCYAAVRSTELAGNAWPVQRV